MFELGQQWLEKYSSGDKELIQNDTFHISNPNGVWIKDSAKKNYWL